MALRALRSVFKRGDDALPDEPAGTSTPGAPAAWGGTSTPGAPAAPAGSHAPGSRYTRGGYVPVRSFNLTAASTAAPAPGTPAAAGDTSAAGGTGSGSATTFGCPSCGRAIPKRSARCEGCGQRLLLDVPARKASMLVGAGVLAGFLVGGALVGLALPRQPAAANAGAPGVAASASPVPISGNAAAALRGTTALNGRLAAEADTLSAALAARSFPVQDVVQVLRRMSTDTRAAAAMVKALDSWPEAASQQAALASFYERLATEINDGLAASATSAGSYKTTTRTILATLARVVDLDTQARSLAAAGGVQLPAVTLPEVLLKG